MNDLLPALPEDWERCLVVAAHPDDIEYGAAVSRRSLHELLLDGVPVRLGTTITALDAQGPVVRAVFNDGSTGDYDLVVGANGVRSWVLTVVFASAPPRFLGMGRTPSSSPRRLPPAGRWRTSRRGADPGSSSCRRRRTGVTAPATCRPSSATRRFGLEGS